jgi:hypothetical protein
MRLLCNALSLTALVLLNRNHVRTVLVTDVKDMVKSCPMMPRLQVGSLSSLVGSWRRRQPVLHTNVLRGLASNKYRHIALVRLYPDTKHLPRSSGGQEKETRAEISAIISSS